MGQMGRGRRLAPQALGDPPTASSLSGLQLECGRLAACTLQLPRSGFIPRALAGCLDLHHRPPLIHRMVQLSRPPPAPPTLSQILHHRVL